jgi:hypothetical protein
VRLADVDDPVGGVLVGAYDVYGFAPGADDFDDDEYDDEFAHDPEHDDADHE